MNKDNFINIQNFSYTKLNEEIEREENNRTLKNFKKSQKPKKDLKKRFLAWGLGATIFAGASIGVGAIINDQTNGDGAYNREIQKKYEQVDETLTKAMGHSPYVHLDNAEITGMYFEEPVNDDVILKIFYEGDTENEFGVDRIDMFEDFSTNIDYYENLVEAENSNNMLYYLDSLNELFANMELCGRCDVSSTITMKLPVNTQENIDIFNDIFNIDNVKTDDLVKQIGFVPYYIDFIEKHTTENPVRTYYTYRIYGVSYCETNSENTAYIKENDKLIINENYDNNHVKAFNRVFTFSSSTDQATINNDLRLSGDIYKIIDEVNNPYTVTDEYFAEVDIFNNYFKLLDGEKKFDKPQDFNVKNYIENQEEIEK